ncbi:MAG: AraC family transcriptional regulator [Pricia sp.]
MRFDGRRPNKNDSWHHHPELELVHISGGNGKRQIGSHVSRYKDGDLIMVGSNLPHYRFTDGLGGDLRETVIQMKRDFLGKRFLEIPETQNIRNLFEIAKEGMVFTGRTKWKVGEKMKVLEYLTDFRRLLGVLNILNELGMSREFRILKADGSQVREDNGENDRIDVVFDHVEHHFREELTLDAISDLVGMTKTAFYRYFKKTTGKTFTRYLNEHRLAHASQLLA